jgi:hypothetical protein
MRDRFIASQYHKADLRSTSPERKAELQQGLDAGEWYPNSGKGRNAQGRFTRKGKPMSSSKAKKVSKLNILMKNRIAAAQAAMVESSRHADARVAEMQARVEEADARVAAAEKNYQQLADLWNAMQAGCGPDKDIKDILKLTARGEMARQLAQKILKFIGEP